MNIETKVDHNYHQLENDKTKQWEKTLTPEYWEYRKKWDNYPLTHQVDRFPIHLDIEATSACNLRCKMCPRTEMVERGDFWKIQHMDWKLYIKIVDEGSAKGLCSIKFNYLGEPLLNPQLCDMIRYAKTKGIIDVMFNTNAVLLNDDNSLKLIESGLDKLFFSFDSPYGDKYNQIRIGADYNKVLTNIKRFMKIREELVSIKPHTRVSMVRMEDNNQEWEDFKKLFSPIVDSVAYVDYIKHTNQENDDIIKIEPKKRSDIDKPKFCCPQLWQRMFVHPDGVVTVCCVDSGRDIYIGNVNGQSIEEIWNSEKYKKLRNLHRTGQIDKLSICSQCHLACVYEDRDTTN